jgi:hypothetical protein
MKSIEPIGVNATYVWRSDILFTTETSIKTKQELPLKDLLALSQKFVEEGNPSEQRKYFTLLSDIAAYSPKSLLVAANIWGMGVRSQDHSIAVDTIKLLDRVGMRCAYNFPVEVSSVLEHGCFKSETQELSLRIFEFFSLKKESKVSKECAASFIQVICDLSAKPEMRVSAYKILCRLAKNNHSIVSQGEPLFRALFEQGGEINTISGLSDFIRFGFKPSNELLSTVISRIPKSDVKVIFDRMQMAKIPISHNNVLAIGQYLDSADYKKQSLEVLLSIAQYQELPDDVREKLCQMIDKPSLEKLQVMLHEILSCGINPFSEIMLEAIAPADKQLSSWSLKTLCSRGQLDDRITNRLKDSIWDIKLPQAVIDAMTIFQGIANSSSFHAFEIQRIKVNQYLKHERCTEELVNIYKNSLFAQAQKGQRLLEQEINIISQDLVTDGVVITSKLVDLLKDERLLNTSFFVTLLAPGSTNKDLFLAEFAKLHEDKQTEPWIRSNIEFVLKLRTTNLVSLSLNDLRSQDSFLVTAGVESLLAASKANYYFNKEQIEQLEKVLEQTSNQDKQIRSKVCKVLCTATLKQNNITTLRSHSVQALCQILTDIDASVKEKFDACNTLGHLIEMKSKACNIEEISDSMAILLDSPEDVLKKVAINGLKKLTNVNAFIGTENLSHKTIQILPNIAYIADVFDLAVTSLHNLAAKCGLTYEESIKRLFNYASDDNLSFSSKAKVSFLTTAYEALGWQITQKLANLVQGKSDQEIDIKTPSYILSLATKLDSMEPDMQLSAIKILNLFKIDDLSLMPQDVLESLIAKTPDSKEALLIKNEACQLLSNILINGYIPSSSLGDIITEKLIYDNFGELALLRSIILISGFQVPDEVVYRLSNLVASSKDLDLSCAAITTLMEAISSKEDSLDYQQIANDLKSTKRLADSNVANLINQALELLESKGGINPSGSFFELLSQSATDITEQTATKLEDIRSKEELLDIMKSSDVAQELSKYDQLGGQLAEIDKHFAVFDNWSGAQIKSWAQSSGGSSSMTEIIATVDKANAIITNGHRLRETQKIAILLMEQDGDKAHLAQMKTGEGKSIVVAAIAIIKALQGKKVDVMTSSPVLAVQGALEKEDLFQMFTLSVNHNIMLDYRKGPKECYESDIVYGDATTFQHDYLRHTYRSFHTRGDRCFGSSFAIVDEVDSMMLDEKDKIAKIASHNPGMEYLAPLLSLLWSKALDLEKQLEEPSEFKLQIQQYGKDLLSQISIPKHLEDFAIKQMSHWAGSALEALNMKEEVNYVILQEDGRDVIAPVDYENTGVTQINTMWQNGLHQFLQLKHQLELKAENLTSAYISNLSFFRLYGTNLCGLTGTLGSQETRNLLSRVYNIDTIEIPTFKKSKLQKLPGIIAENEVQHLEQIAVRLAEEVNVNNRAALVICDSILSARKIAQIAEQISEKVRLYIRSDEISENTIEYITNGEIIIATNLAGRGTDIKTSKSLEDTGGMYQCTTFLPRNKRCAEQAEGRTARQGNQGSCQLIINKEKTVAKYGGSNLNTIEKFEALRDEYERASLVEVESYKIPQILAEDALQQEFAEFAQELGRIDGDQHKVLSLEEQWGLWLKTQSNVSQQDFDIQRLNADFEVFKAKQKQGKIDNPVYLTRRAYDLMSSGDYEGSLQYYTQSIEKDPSYQFIAAYNMAYAVIRANNKNSKNYNGDCVAQAAGYLLSSKTSIDKAIAANRQAQQAVAREEGMPLHNQFEARITVLELQKSYIDQAHEVVGSIQKNQMVTIGHYSRLNEIFPESHPYKGVIMEFNQAGLHLFYQLGGKSKPKDKGSMIVGMAAATLTASWTGGLSFSLFGLGLQAMASSFAGRLGSSIFDNQGKVGKALKDVTKTRSLREVALDGVTSALFAGAVKGLGIAELDKVSGVARHTRIAQQHAIKAAISTTIRGEKFKDAFKREVINSLGASTANMIGDIGLENGSRFKAGLHGIASGVISTAQGGDFDTGFTSGFMTESLSGTAIGRAGSGQFTPILVAGVIGAIGKSEEEMARAANLSSSIIAYNHNIHGDPISQSQEEEDAKQLEKLDKYYGKQQLNAYNQQEEEQRVLNPYQVAKRVQLEYFGKYPKYRDKKFLIPFDVVGEVVRYDFHNLGVAIGHVPGSHYVLEPIGSTLHSGLDLAKSGLGSATSYFIGEDQFNYWMNKFKQSPRGVQFFCNDALETGLLMGAGKFAHTGYKGVKSVIPGGKTAVAIFGDATYLEKPLIIEPKAYDINLLSAKAVRNSPGIVQGTNSFLTVKEGDIWLKGKHGNAGTIPGQIAEKMVGMEFKSFDDFRKAFWKNVAADANLSKGFEVKNLARMQKGMAPVVQHTGQQVGQLDKYNLHHKKPISSGGEVYNLDNIIIVTPQYHSQFHTKKVKQKSK